MTENTRLQLVCPVCGGLLWIPWDEDFYKRDVCFGKLYYKIAIPLQRNPRYVARCEECGEHIIVFYETVSLRTVDEEVEYRQAIADLVRELEES